jgi:hypothetical protein
VGAWGCGAFGGRQFGRFAFGCTPACGSVVGLRPGFVPGASPQAGIRRAFGPLLAFVG